MVMTPMSGNGPFQDDGDGDVSARLSVDVPQDAVANLNQLMSATHDLRANMEATARAQGDFIEYLKQLPEVMAASEQASERFFTSAAGNIMSDLGPDSTPGATPLRRGKGSSRNDAVRPDHSNTPGSGGQQRVEQQLNELKENDPRQYANMVAQNGDGRTIHRGGDEVPGRGGGRTGGGGAGTGPGGPTSPPSGPAAPSGPGRTPGGEGPQNSGGIDWAERIQKLQGSGSGFLNSVLSQTAAGGRGSGLDIINAGVGGLRGMAQRHQANVQSQMQDAAARATAEARERGMDEASTAAHVAQATGRFSGSAGMAGTLVKGAGVAGAVVGVGLAANQAGEWYQGMRAQGATRGGGAAEGMAFEMGVRTMAMNPFLSTEQSRKIMTSALNEGYTGKEFDTVTDFMADNLKKMNMDVAESVRLLRTNVNKGGQSIAGAQQDIGAVSRMAQNDDVRQTSDQLRQTYSNVMDTLTTGPGAAGGADASAFAQLLTSYGSTDPNLKGFGEKLASAASNNPMMARKVAPDGYTGNFRGALAAGLDDPDGDVNAFKDINQAVIDIVGNPHVQKLLANENTAVNGVLTIKARLKAMGVDATDEEVRALVRQYQSGDLQKETERSISERKKSLTGGKVEKKSLSKKVGNLSKGVGQGVLAGVGWLASPLDAVMSGDPISDWSSENWDDAVRNTRDMTNDIYSNKRIEELMDEYGRGNITVKNKDGKEQKLDYKALEDEGLMNDLVSGKAQLKLPGSRDFTTMESIGAQTDGEKGSGGGVYDLTDRAAQLLKLLPNGGQSLNQTQRSSNYAEDNATRNNARSDETYDPPAPGGN